MKYILKKESIVVPEGVTVTSKSRTFTVEGPRGKLVKSFKHIKCAVTVGQEENSEGVKQTVITIEMYLNTYKQAALLKTIKGHISNMITGVTKGFRYKMHTVFKHFGIDLSINDKVVSIKHFLGETAVKCIKLREGVTATLKGKDQEEIWFEGNDINAVSLNCSDMALSTKVFNKDRRMFLDGIYVMEKGNIEEES